LYAFDFKGVSQIDHFFGRHSKALAAYGFFVFFKHKSTDLSTASGGKPKKHSYRNHLKNIPRNDWRKER
jgi:hypothetical protein